MRSIIPDFVILLRIPLEVFYNKLPISPALIAHEIILPFNVFYIKFLIQISYFRTIVI